MEGGYTEFRDENLPPAPTLKSSIKATLTLSWLNLLLVFVPIGYILGLNQASEPLVFMVNCLGIIPLAGLLGFATEEIALRTSQTIGGLLNATFGNLILGLLALKEGLVRVVQASLLGSILSNLLLVLGMSFVAGGFKFREQKFNATAAQTNGSLLAITVVSIMIPAAFSAEISELNRPELVLYLSRGTALVLLAIYIMFLAFQLKTHSYLFEDESEQEEEHPHLTQKFALFLLILVSALVAGSAELVVSSIEGLSKEWNLSETFVGLILLPIIGNAAEHTTAVFSAAQNKMDLSLGVALGSSMQIALLVTPIMVIFGWFLHIPMTMHFTTFETAVMFVSIYVVNCIIQDGSSNWLEGAMLCGGYLIIAIAFFLLPSAEPTGPLLVIQTP